MRKRRLLSMILAAVMAFTTLPVEVFATETDLPVGESYFDFEASEYVTDETDGVLEIKVYRHGSTDGAVNVAVKAADFLSAYGEDYDILIDGQPMTAVDGDVIDPSRFTYVEDSDPALPTEAETVAEALPAEPETAPEAETAAEPEPSTDTDLATPSELAGENEPAEEDPAPAADENQLPVNENKQAVKTGSPLRDAQAAYLGLAPADVAETEDNATELLSELYGFFAGSRGAEGVLHFRSGDRYRTLTVRIRNNDEPDGARMFLLGLMGTDSDSTTVAANATTYVTIADDEAQESAVFTLEAPRTVLTEEAPTAEVTVRRTEGMQYFSQAYVSTVSETADPDAYEDLSLKTVAFAPGQETATVTVTGLEFSQDGSFGVRLEANDADEVEDHYVSIAMASDGVAAASAAPMATRLRGGGTVFGSGYVRYGEGGGSWYDMGNGFGADVNGSDYPAATVKTVPRYDGDGNFLYNDYHLEVYNENKGHYSMLYTASPMDMVGVMSIQYCLDINDKGDHKHTRVEMDCDTTYEGNTVGDSFDGNRDWGTNTLDTSWLWNWGVGLPYENAGTGYHHFKFIAECTKNGNKNHAHAEISWLQLHYALYSFDLQPSSQAYPGYLYDFTELDGSGPRIVTMNRQIGTDDNGQPIYAADRLYHGPALTMRTLDGADIAGFYNNWSGTAVLEPSEALPVGLHLKALCFSQGDPYDYETGAYAASAYYVPVSDDGKIYVDLNRDFIRNLMNHGTIPGQTADANIQVYPVYEEDTAWVNFDYLGHEPAADGSYTDDAANARINNLDQCGLETYWYENFQYYTIQVPMGSVLRLSMTPAGDRTAAGFRYWTHDGTTCETVYYHYNDHILDPGSAEGYKVQAATDYTKADIVAGKSMSMVPVTGVQDLYVGYSPQDFKYRPDRETTDPKTGSVTKSKDYTNVVIDYSHGVPATTTDIVGTDKNGSMTLSPVNVGDDILLMAEPPKGYYTSWADLTGDINGDGTVDDAEQAAAGTRRRNGDAGSNAPHYVYGNLLAFAPDEDNTRYYYYFIQSDPHNTRTKTGTLYRQSSTLYDLAAGNPVTATEPVAGAYVNVAGSVGMTDADGHYEVQLDSSMPSWGLVSMYYTVDGVTYNTTDSLERASFQNLPALDHFTAHCATASYTWFANDDDQSKGIVNGQVVSILDGTLSITAGVRYSGAIVPAKAHFTIVGDNGTTKVVCDTAEGYTITSETQNYDSQSNTFLATLTFNPKKDMSGGDRIYVAFEDSAGHVYTAIDVGFTFYSELTLEDLILPAIGPDIGDAVTTGFVADLIGDPLAYLDMGKFSGLSGKWEDYSPPGVSKTKPIPEEYQWHLNTFSWNYSTNFEPKTKDKDGNKKDEKEAVEEVGKDLEKKAESDIPAGTTTAGAAGAAQSGSGFSTKGSYHFDITPTVGWQLKLTQRTVTDDKGVKSEKVFFEDLVIYVKCDANASCEHIIETPIGINVLIKVDLTKDGDNSIVTGIYRMYVAYQDSFQTEDAVPYDETFSFFKTGNDARRHEGYIFLNPLITVRLGVGVGVAYVFGQAAFAFDMDFRFTGSDNYSYGQMTIQGEWGVQIMGFDVYTQEFGDGYTKKLFSGNTNQPFGFDDLVTAANSNALQAMNGVLGGSGEAFAPTLADRNQKGGWKGSAGSGLHGSMLGTVESVMQTGSSHNQQFRPVPFGTEGQALAVFVDDAPDRSDANARAVYWSVRGTDGSWSEPQIIDDDKTADDYPYAEALGDGRILVVWSSAEDELDDNVTLEQSLQSLILEYAVFDTDPEKLSMSADTHLTCSTDQDHAADLQPRIAYDATSDKAVLYYIKNEYKDLDSLDDISKAASAVMYRIYDPATGWSDGDSYDDAELAHMSDAEKAAFRENWYGQRFLDLGLGTATDLPLVVASDAADYDGMGLFAYVVDWDCDQTTLNDRDIFLRTYDFEHGRVTHIARVSPDTGWYGDVELEKSKNTTYLFCGVKDDNDDDSTIRVIDVGHYLTRGTFVPVTNGTMSYEVLQKDGKAMQAETATVCHNMHDYSAVVTDDGRIYLLWTDVTEQEKGRDIHAVVYNNADGGDDPEAEDSDEETSLWSQPITLTNSDQDTFYNGFGAMAEGDGDLVILSGKGSFSDRSTHGVVQVVHRPYAKVELDEALTLGNNYAAPGDVLSVTATLKNEGMLQDHDGETVTFYVNGTEAATVKYDKFIPGGGTAYVSTGIIVPEGDDVTVTAKCGSREASGTLLRGARLSAEHEALDYVTDRNNVHTYERDFSAVLFNTGNQATGEVKLAATAGSRVLAETALPSIAPKASAAAELRIPFDETLYTLNETTGLATLDVVITASAGDEVLYSYSKTLERQYDPAAIAALKTYAGVSGTTFHMDVNDSELLQPTVAGEDLRVEWLHSLAPEVAWLDSAGGTNAASRGTATLTGIVVPDWAVHEANSSGAFRRKDWTELVPGYLLQPVTATVYVGPASTSDSEFLGESTSGGGTVATASATKSLTLSLGISGVSMVMVDGRAVDPAYYTVSPDGTVTLSAAFLQMLGGGTHTITTSNGVTTASANFTVKSAKTADYTVMSLYVSLLGLGLMVAAALIASCKRRQYCR